MHGCKHKLIEGVVDSRIDEVREESDTKIERWDNLQLNSV